MVCFIGGIGRILHNQKNNRGVVRCVCPQAQRTFMVTGLTMAGTLILFWFHCLVSLFLHR